MLCRPAKFCHTKSRCCGPQKLLADIPRKQSFPDLNLLDGQASRSSDNFPIELQVNVQVTNRQIPLQSRKQTT